MISESISQDVSDSYVSKHDMRTQFLLTEIDLHYFLTRNNLNKGTIEKLQYRSSTHTYKLYLFSFSYRGQVENCFKNFIHMIFS